MAAVSSGTSTFLNQLLHHVLLPVYLISLSIVQVIMGFPPHFLRSQVWTTLPVSTSDYTGQTVIVTGSNTGLGLEAARHLVRLGAAKVILGVRNLQKGEAAKSSIEASESSSGVVEVWELDLASYASVKQFGERVKGLQRLDVLVGNAGIRMFSWQMAELDEITITVNVVSTFLLALLCLPKLRETSVQYKKETVVTLTGSFVHYLTAFEERRQSNIFKSMTLDETADLQERYNVSKMIELLCLREFAKRLTSSEKAGTVTANIINPGYVHTEILRDAGWLLRIFMVILRMTLSRTAEEGARTLLAGAEGGEAKHGQYLDDCVPAEVSDFVTSDDGRQAQKKVWDELAVKLEGIAPGIMSTI